MSKLDKLINKILKLDKGLRFDELVKVLEKMGYTMNSPKGGSSHFTFRKPNKTPITIPKDEPIDKVYVKLVKDAILEHEREVD